MGKNRKSNPKNKELGRTLIKGRNNTRQNRVNIGSDCWRHNSDLQDGNDWNRLNLKSVTEKDTLDEFLDTAEMAGVEFTAEKLNIQVVGPGTIATGVLGDCEKARLRELQNEHKKFITIPRRPPWDDDTSAEQLDRSEKEVFLNWRRGLALLKEKYELLLTPYEKNLDVWRQLWRVIERSDVICQIVDARNPLLYKCDDLEVYIKEVNPLKEYIVLINKADYLTEKQRLSWAKYFDSQKTKVIFFSALEEMTKPGDDEILEKVVGTLELKDSEYSSEEDESDFDCCKRESEDNGCNEVSNAIENLSDSINVPLNESNNINLNVTSTDMLSREELVKYFKTFTKVNNDNAYITVGLVGYPNVGKSSTINALILEKKTAVSATPGKTKHFQTHFIGNDLCICDCPGLVFPSFVFTKAHLVLNGILPVDQMRDHMSPVALLAQQIRRKVIESTYGINIPKPTEFEDPTRLPTAEEILSSYAKMRGFMTSNGLPDCSRASRYILKDFLRGKLLYCHPPPGLFGDNFEQSQVSSKVLERIVKKELCEKNIGKQNIAKVKISSIDKDFFSEKQIGSYSKVPTGTKGNIPDSNLHNVNKPWKKHNNRNKKEKLRRIYNEN